MATSLKSDRRKTRGAKSYDMLASYRIRIQPSTINVESEGGYMMGKLIIELKRKYHKAMMNYNLELYRGCLEPNMKKQLYQKASLHQEKYLV